MWNSGNLNDFILHVVTFWSRFVPQHHYLSSVGLKYKGNYWESNNNYLGWIHFNWNLTLKFNTCRVNWLLGANIQIWSSQWGSRGCAVVRALASHQCALDSIPKLSVIYICGFSLLVLFSIAKGFSPGTPVLPHPQKTYLILVNFIGFPN